MISETTCDFLQFSAGHFERLHLHKWFVLYIKMKLRMSFIVWWYRNIYNHRNSSEILASLPIRRLLLLVAMLEKFDRTAVLNRLSPV